MFRICAPLAALASVFTVSMSLPAAADENRAPGSIYTETNAPGGNAIVIFPRSALGTVGAPQLVPTGGAGTGAGLGSQGSVVLSEDGRWLFAVNAGSSSISTFAVLHDGITLAGVTPSGGTMPTSLTVHDDLLYVLNAGTPNNITGFAIGHNGSLHALPNSTRPLSAASTGPAQVQFSPHGDLLVVTEKSTSLIDTYTVGPDGRPSPPIVQASNGPTPFGFAFGKRDDLVVSEAVGTVSSYVAQPGGTLRVATGSAPTHQAAPCWIAITGDGRYAYAADAGSNAITGYRIDHDGQIALLNANGLTAGTGAGSHPIDMATTENGRFLAVLLSNAGKVAVFRIAEDGSLTAVSMAGGLPASVSGLAAR